MSENQTIYCGQCGTENPRENRFCGHCGAKLQPTAVVDVQIEYEYKALKVSAEVGTDFGRVSARIGFAHEIVSALTEQQARIHFWQAGQSQIYTHLEEETRQGWQPYTEVGPGCIKLESTITRPSSGGLAGFVFGKVLTPQWCYVGFEIGLKRVIKH